MSWYIGQKIICVKAHKEGVVKRGQVFAIKDIRESICHCDDVELDIGCKIPDMNGSDKYSIRCDWCGTFTPLTDNTWWLSATRFAPIQDEEIGNTTTEAILEEIEYHELQEA